MKATFIRDVNPESRGKQRLYELDEPLDGYTTVIVSAVGDDAPVSPELKLTSEMAGMAGSILGAEMDYSRTDSETFIFGANGAGEIIDWGELEGSYQGGSDHARALRNAGYEIEEDA